MSANLTQLWCTLVTANHILDYFSLVTGYGHMSVRNPLTNTTFFFDTITIPALVTSGDSYVEWNVSNGAPISDPSATINSLSEIWIHQGIYNRYPEVNSVVHSHSRAVLPFADTEVSLVPQINLEADLGAQIPVFDIIDYYSPNDTHNFLINLPRLGAAFANSFSTAENNVSKRNTFPDHPVVLQRAHGFTAAARSIEHVIWATWSTQDAANIARESYTVLAAYEDGVARLREFTEQQLRDSAAVGQTGEVKDWPWFVSQVVRRGGYKNDVC